jgi:uncharacterized protein YbjT (DUF2867 family)
MYAITGITGQVGGVLAHTLLQGGQAVRAVVRDAAKGARWAALGCEVAIADAADSAALTRAFSGVDGVFILLPPNFDPSDDFPETRAIVAAFDSALRAAAPARVVCLSTIGAQASEPNLLQQLGHMEQVLGRLSMPVAFLRAAWFMENFAWDVAGARAQGLLASHLQPLDQAQPMIATADIGRLAAELLQQSWTGARVVELEGPARYSPHDAAAAFAAVLNRPVRAEAVARDGWEAQFRGAGMLHPLPRMQMLDGFNAGWIRFEADQQGTVKGKTTLAQVLAGLAGSAHDHQ